MYQFDYINITDEKDTKQNIKLIKSYLDDMTDKLNMLSQRIEEIDEKQRGVK